MFPPIEYEDETKQHTTQMCKMGHSVGHGDAFNQLNDSIDDYKPFGLDGHDKIEIDVVVGEKHAKGKQESVDST